MVKKDVHHLIVKNQKRLNISFFVFQCLPVYLLVWVDSVVNVVRLNLIMIFTNPKEVIGARSVFCSELENIREKKGWTPNIKKWKVLNKKRDE